MIWANAQRRSIWLYGVNQKDTDNQNNENGYIKYIN